MVLNEGKPVEQSEIGYTGNAGMEIEYWYHYGAVFLWPRKYHFNMLVDLPSDNKLEWLAYYNQHWDESNNAVVKQLAESDFQSGESICKLDFTLLAEFLVNLHDREYLSLRGKALLVNYFSLIAVQSWVRLFEEYGAGDFVEIFEVIIKSGQSKDLEHQLTICRHLVATDDRFAAFVFGHTERIPFNLQALNLSELPKEHARTIVREVLTLSKTKILDLAWLKNTAEAITRILTRDFVDDVLVEVVLKADEKSVLGRQVLEICLDDLRQRVKNQPRPPADLSRPVSATRAFSKVWMVLAPFLKSATLVVLEYRAAESLRREMEAAIRSVTIDLTMETIKQGSPYTLRLTKTRAGYLRALAVWESDVRLLKEAEGM